MPRQVSLFWGNAWEGPKADEINFHKFPKLEVLILLLILGKCVVGS